MENARARLWMLAGESEAVVQFQGLLDMAALGFERGPKGRRCPTCGRLGQVWIREPEAGKEVHQCAGCGWRKEYAT